MTFTRAQIRQALHPTDDVPRLPVTGDDSEHPPRDAAVLVPLLADGDHWQVLLTVRTGHLTTHAGQISFPGGSLEPDDDGPVAAALRETREETGIAPRFVEVAGCLDRYRTVTGFLMTPVVGFLEPGFDLAPCPDEVEELFWMPLERAIGRSRYERRSLTFRGRRRHFLTQDFDGRAVWGATAAILVAFGDRLMEASRALDDAT